MRASGIALFTGCLLTAGCGERYGELYVTRIEAPATARVGQVVEVTLIDPHTPNGSTTMVWSVAIDDAARRVTFTALERNWVGSSAFPYPQVVVDRRTTARFTPGAAGTWALATRNAAPLATIEVTP